MPSLRSVSTVPSSNAVRVCSGVRRPLTGTGARGSPHTRRESQRSGQDRGEQGEYSVTGAQDDTGYTATPSASPARAPSEVPTSVVHTTHRASTTPSGRCAPRMSTSGIVIERSLKYYAGSGDVDQLATLGVP